MLSSHIIGNEKGIYNACNKENRNITPVLDLESLISIIFNDYRVESRTKPSLIG